MAIFPMTLTDFVHNLDNKQTNANESLPYWRRQNDCYLKPHATWLLGLGLGLEAKFSGLGLETSGLGLGLGL